jgi:hypothetical protein
LFVLSEVNRYPRYVPTWRSSEYEIERIREAAQLEQANIQRREAAAAVEARERIHNGARLTKDALDVTADLRNEIHRKYGDDPFMMAVAGDWLMDRIYDARNIIGEYSERRRYW